MLIFFSSCMDDGKEEYQKPLPAVKFEEPFNNAKIQRGKFLQVAITIQEPSELSEMALYTKDSTFYSGIPSEKELVFELDTRRWKVGTNQLTVESTLKDGKKVKDNRIIKVLSDIYPTDYTVKVINAYPHLTSSYTQGDRKSVV